MKLVTDIKEAKYITHSGTMHTDEVFATAFLDLLKKDITLIRVPQVEIDKIEKDVLVYDIGRGKYDHHQDDAKTRENGIKYSSFGLLFQEFGKEYLKQLKIEDIEEVFNTIDKELVEGIDAVDNGVFPEINANFKVKTLDDIIKACNPSFGSNQDENEQFIKAVGIAKIIFQEIIHNIVGKVKAKKIILQKLKVTEKDYLELEEYIPYEETILKNEEGNHILFALYPSNRGGWGIKTIKKSAEDKTDRLSFPENWAGLENQELEKITGIKDVTFCHSGRFLMTCKTKEAAYKVLEKVLNQTE
ncbi:MAG: MYG1 family protein [Candidatus Faecimonas sp.]|nr:MYG1 family protein [Candidatus Faecimonas sp.]